MPVNQYFNNYNYFNEQDLIEDLVVESIKMYGVDMYYITRSYINGNDQILNENDTTKFDGAYVVEMYVKTNDGFAGQGDFLSKFGLQMQDQATFTVSRRSFDEYVLSHKPDILRPREGDIVYFPILKKMYAISHVEHESVFYQTGALQVFDLACELLEYSNEIFETGVSEIDNYTNSIKLKERTDSLTDMLDTSKISKNIFFEDETETLLDQTEFDPFKEVITNPSKV